MKKSSRNTKRNNGEINEKKPKMQNLGPGSPADDLDIANVKAKIDNKPPAVDIDSYYKPNSLVADAETVMKIDTENFELLKKINTIHRLGGQVDCWNREFNSKSPLLEKQSDDDAIIEANKAMMLKIENATGLYRTADLMRQWNESRATKKSSKDVLSKDSKSVANRSNKRSSRFSKKISLSKPIEDSARPRCFFDIEIENDHRQLGKLIFQLFADIVPKTCDNFLSFCSGFEGFSYKGTPFHRIVPGYWCQGGDVTKFNGSGGTSIYGETFEDENFQLKHSERGILSTCSYDKNANNSKFNLTFERLETMDGKNVVFGKVIGGFSTLREMERFGTRYGKPIMKIVVSKCGVL